MNESEVTKVNASRAGDQFHYTWTARRCLALLPPNSNLVAISIEGPSFREESEFGGEDVIDIAEYFDGESIDAASLIRVTQFKHSTLRSDQELTVSAFKKTLIGFLARYLEVSQHNPSVGQEFQIITNQPIDKKFQETLEDIVNNTAARHKEVRKYLSAKITTDDFVLGELCRRLRVVGRSPNLREQTAQLRRDLEGYLPGPDYEAATELKDLVARRAAALGPSDRSIRRVDVLRALNVEPDRLFPAPNEIQASPTAFAREREPEIWRAIVECESGRMILHADGGVGKSVIASRIHLGLPAGSHCVVFDCFGNGTYRRPSAPRHPHSVGLVQIANEVASAGLCDLLVPSASADPSQYMRAFLARIQEAAAVLAGRIDGALLCIVVDAGDNAEDEARERGEKGSFVKDLLKERFPENGRVVALCRTHRRHLLDPTSDVAQLQIDGFILNETALHLRSAFPDASEGQVKEFHRMTSQNARVQRMALDGARADGANLEAMLRALGSAPVTIDLAIEALLDRALARVRDAAGDVEKSQIDRLCVALATLRPFVPVEVLRLVSGVPEGAIRSFASDLGRSLLLSGDSLQFIDEPTESWFRKRFRPREAELKEFIQKLKPLAITQDYVAASLPQIMLEAGELKELIELALSDKNLPQDPLQRRETQNERQQFALKAALRAGLFGDACRISFAAAIETVGSGRQSQLFRENTDLVAKFLPQARVEELVSKRFLAEDDRPGSRYAYEAALQSHFEALDGATRARFRTAEEHVHGWLRSKKRNHFKALVTDELLAELAMAVLNVVGAVPTARFLRSWRPRETSMRVGQRLAERLVDHGRFAEVDNLYRAARNDVWLVIGLTVALRRVHRYPPQEAVRRALKVLTRQKVVVQARSDWRYDSLEAVGCLIEAAIKHNVGSPLERARVLARHLPDKPPRLLFDQMFRHERLGVLNAYVLHAFSEGKQVVPIELAHDDLRKEIQSSNRHHRTRDRDAFEAVTGALLPWLELRVRVVAGAVTKTTLSTEIAEISARSSKAMSSLYGDGAMICDDIILARFSVLVESGLTSEADIGGLVESVERLRERLLIPTIVSLTRGACRNSGLEKQGLIWSSDLRSKIDGYQEGADSKIGSYVDLCRAILSVSNQGAQEIFNDAVELSTRLGDEHVERWSAILDLADRADATTGGSPELAYKLARGAELTYEHIVRDKYFDWEGTVRAICGLCSRSGFAILSRWRDREFGSQEELLPEAVEFLVERGVLDPVLGISLYPFRGNWRRSKMLEQLLRRTADKLRLKEIIDWFFWYCVRDESAGDDWREIEAVLESQGLATDQFSHSSKSVIEHHARRTIEEGDDDPKAASELEKAERALSLEGIDLRTSGDVAAAVERRRASPGHVSAQEFFAEIAISVPAGGEPDFICAFADLPNTSWRALEELISNFPKGWSGLPGIKTALASAIRTVCRRSHLQFSIARGWDCWPMEKVFELSGVTEKETAGIVVDAISHTPGKLSSSRLFSLVGLLARLIEPQEIRPVLSDCLGKFDPDLRPEHGDGEWRAELSPRGTIGECVAGYVWAALASPSDTIRWQAAHIVRSWGRLGLVNPLDHLFVLLDSCDPRPYVDSNFRFYGLHAKQWLMLAMARIALESPSIAARFQRQIKLVALEEPKHPLIATYAAQAVLAMAENGAIEIEEFEREKLTRVGRSPLAYAKERRLPAASPSPSQRDESGYFFFPDIGPYWLAPIGRIFGMTQAEIEKAVLSTMRVHLGFTSDSRWRDDARMKRGQLKDESSRHSHGSYPHKDDEYFYCAYHAMMIVAGQLLKSSPVVKSSVLEVDPFVDWVRGHRATLADGRWMADCRDPLPIRHLPAIRDLDPESWKTSVTKDSFLRPLLPTPDRLCVWGDWTESEGSRYQRVDVTSALVSSENANSLLRALQTADDFHDYRLPAFGDFDFNIRRSGFRLRGWISELSHNCELGRRDPWSGKITDRFYRPAPPVVRLLRLRSEANGRIYRDTDGSEAIWCSTWSEQSAESVRKGGEEGNRILVRRDFLLQFLSRVGMDLIVEVDLRRGVIKQDYERSADDVGWYDSSYVRLFLVRASGEVASL